jgi:TRAP transporter TAXI family solute receptor
VKNDVESAQFRPVSNIEKEEKMRGTMDRFLKRLLVIGLVSTITLVISTKEPLAAPWTKPISIASGSIGSLHYMIMTGIAGLITRHMGVNTTAEATTWSAANVDLLRKKEVELASCTADAVYDAWQAKGYFEGKPQRFLRLIHSGYITCATTVTRPDSGIKTHADLKGKRFYAWHPTSPFIQRCCNVILEANQLTRENLRLMDVVSTKEAVSALTEGRCDAVLIVGGPPTAAIVELTNTMACSIIPIGDPEVQVMKKKYPFLFPYLLPPNTYKGQTKELLIQGGKTHFVCREDLPDELIYQITKVLMENPGDVGAIHPQAKEVVLKTFFYNPQAPFHPGAIKYYKEVGMWTADMQKVQDQLISAKK